MAILNPMKEICAVGLDEEGAWFDYFGISFTDEAAEGRKKMGYKVVRVEIREVRKR
jgi:hypothetical protein